MIENDNKVFRIGIIGAGLQGGRRAPVLKQLPGFELVIVADICQQAAVKLAQNNNCRWTLNWQEVIDRPDIDIILVCTPPHLHAQLSIAAMETGKHVLCEKPLSRTLEEAQEMLLTAEKNNVILKCGFNHRHHPAIKKAVEIISGGAIGEIDFIRAAYGIGGRPGYEKEWRADPAVVSGGQLMEQGIHVVDIFRCLLGNFVEVNGFMSARYWGISPLEDNAFALFRTAAGQIASLHSSLTQWKNIFKLEIYGHEGYIHIEGLGGSYGTEKITVGKKEFYEPFRDETTEYRGGDVSWLEEWKEFITAIRENRQPLGNGQDGLEALRLVNAVYEAAHSGKTVQV